jgi:hypothetical protein
MDDGKGFQNKNEKMRGMEKSYRNNKSEEIPLH